MTEERNTQMPAKVLGEFATSLRDLRWKVENDGGTQQVVSDVAAIILIQQAYRAGWEAGFEVGENA